jgi:hypothetical protein
MSLYNFAIINCNFKTSFKLVSLCIIMLPASGVRLSPLFLFQENHQQSGQCFPATCRRLGGPCVHVHRSAGPRRPDDSDGSSAPVTDDGIS